MDKLIRFQ